MLQDNTGKMWFATSVGVFCYDGNAFTKFLENDSVRNDSSLHLRMVQCMYQDKSGNIWFGSGFAEQEGACRFDGKSITNVHPNGAGWIRTIIEDKRGRLYFATRNRGVCRLDGDRFTNISAKAGINNGDVNQVLEDRSGNFWIPTESGSGDRGEAGGLWRLNDTSATHFTTDDGLIHNGVYCVVEDRDGNLWIGTRNTGLSRYDGKTFKTFSE